MARVLVTEQLDDAGLELLRTAGHTTDVQLDLAPAELLEAIVGAEGLLIRSATQVTADVIAAGSSLVVVGRAGVGVDNVDVTAAHAAGVTVCNAPTANVTSAAELTVGLILAAARHIPQAHASLHAGRWDRKLFTGTELAGKTAGIVGLGRVGRLVAQRLAAFDMELLAYDPYVSAESAAEAGARACELPELMAASDVITVHLPRTDETAGLIGASTLPLCKPTAIIINAARGGVVDEVALTEHLTAGKLAAAAVDTWENEPNVSSPLLGRGDVVVTPHLGASTGDAQVRAATTVAEEVCAVLAGEQPRFAVGG